MKIIILLALLSNVAFSAELLKLSWTLPTARTDGTKLEASELAYTTVIWVCNGKEGSKNVNSPETETNVGMPSPGECTYYATVTDTNGLTSARSEPYTYEGVKANPEAPIWNM